ncbi:MAG: hypothetical protein OJF49_001500 [Ktedonobacterales bacterium]|nr:MAG: hypothetical protein OJF49_001500 [Ktedonobacterales bacterium]
MYLGRGGAAGREALALDWRDADGVVGRDVLALPCGDTGGVGNVNVAGCGSGWLSSSGGWVGS